MRRELFKIILFGITLSTLVPELSWACKPAANFIAPTLAENFSRASQVFSGKVTAKIKTAERFEVSVTYTKVWKPSEGIVKKKNLTLLLNKPNTCDPFAIDIAVGDFCVFFVGEKGHVMSGLFAGDSSKCLHGNGVTEAEFLAPYEEAQRAAKK